MSTFLQLCQGVTRESGTFTGTTPTAVTSQSGRLLKVVNWTAEAWQIIQNLHNAWRFMRTEFTLSDTITIANTARYTPAAWNITDHAEWIFEQELISMYKTATGVSDEGNLIPILWHEFRRMYTKGTQTATRPVHWAISPANQFCLGPKPDAVYTVNGEYRKTSVIMDANTDEPDLPVRFHPIIIWKGVLLLAEHDEAPPDAMITANRKYAEYLGGLERDQLPQIRIGSEPLA